MPAHLTDKDLQRLQEAWEKNDANRLELLKAAIDIYRETFEAPIGGDNAYKIGLIGMMVQKYHSYRRPGAFLKAYETFFDDEELPQRTGSCTRG